MNKKSWIIIFFALIILPTLLSFVIDDKNNEGENRMLSSMPKFSPDTIIEYPREFEDYYSDNIPFRNTLVELNNRIEYYILHDSPNKDVLLAKDGWLFYRPEQIDCYKKNNLYSDEKLSVAAEYFQDVYDYCAERGAEFMIFIAPDKAEIYPEKLPKHIKVSPDADKSRAEEFRDYINENTDVKVIYPKDELIKSRKYTAEEALYYPLDTHWNQLGAYVGTRCLVEKLGLDMPELNGVKYRRNKAENFGLPGMLGIRNMKPNGFSYGVCGYEGNSRILEYDGARSNEVRIKTENALSDKKIMFLRDSFFTAMEPYVGACFGEVYAPHYTLVYDAGMIDKEKPDIVVLEVVERSLDIITYTDIIPYSSESVWDRFNPE